MAKADILRTVRQQVQAMDFAIENIRGKSTETNENTVKVDLAGRLAGLIEQRNELVQKLNEWEALSDDRWSNLETQIEIEWQTLVQDLEERWGPLK